MDWTSRTACFLSQTDGANRDQPSPKSWGSFSPTGPTFNGDQVWLEELIGLSSNQSSSSQPSSPSVPSGSPGGSRSSSEGTGSLNSWGSGVTGLLHSSIKKQSQEAFHTRLREVRGLVKRAEHPSRGPRCNAHPQVEQGGGSCHNALHQGRGSTHTHGSADSVKVQWLLQDKIDAKLKFSQFLDEVTSNVLDPNSLQAFGKTVSPSGFTSRNPDQPEDQVKVVSSRLLCSMAQQQKTPEEQTSPELAQKKYLETDIDTVRRDDEKQGHEVKAETPLKLEIDEGNLIPPPPQFCQGFEMKNFHPEFRRDFPRYPYRSVSLPRGINMVPDEEMNNIDTVRINTDRALSNSAGQT